MQIFKNAVDWLINQGSLEQNGNITIYIVQKLDKTRKKNKKRGSQKFNRKEIHQTGEVYSERYFNWENDDLWKPFPYLTISSA